MQVVPSLKDTRDDLRVIISDSFQYSVETVMKRLRRCIAWHRQMQGTFIGDHRACTVKLDLSGNASKQKMAAVSL